jgi:lipopolysaccharide export system permease protein
VTLAGDPPPVKGRRMNSVAPVPTHEVGCAAVRILHWYILKQHLVPLLLGFGVVTFILEMDVLFDYLDLVINRGVAPLAVLQLFMLSLGYIVALSVPCAVLVAVLMTFGRLSQDNEITALRASGVNLASILVGPLLAAALLAAGLTLFNDRVLPESNHAFANLLIDIGRMRPTVKLQEGVFITDFPGYNLLVQSVNGRTNEMRGVTIYQMNAGGPPNLILAKRGFLTYTPDGRTAVLELKDGEIHEIPADEGGSRKYRRMQFKTHIIHIQGAGAILERSVREARSDREMSAGQLGRERRRVIEQDQRSTAQHLERLAAYGLTARDLQAAIPAGLSWDARVATALRALLGGSPALDRAEQENPPVRVELELWRLEHEALERRAGALSVEIHKKFSLPAACVVFVLIGAPLGMRVRRAGPAVAFVSVAFFLFYYLCLIGGEELANRLLLPPWLAMWLPNLVLGTWGLLATLRAVDLWRPRTARVPARNRGPGAGLPAFSRGGGRPA